MRVFAGSNARFVARQFYDKTVTPSYLSPRVPFPVTFAQDPPQAGPRESREGGEHSKGFVG
jgi:hypothetical protein